MVYESDFYTTRRPYRASPSLSTYTITTPRYYTVRDSPDTSRRSAEEQYSYSYSSEAKNSSDPYSQYSRPMNRSYSTTERVSRSTDAGPGRYTYSNESSSRSRGDGPGGYHSSYSSTTSGRLPGGTGYRHYSYRSEPSRQVRLLPGLGKVHVVHSYDRIVPYVGHKRLTVVTSPPVVLRCRPSTLYKEFSRIEHKLRPISYNSYTNDYLNSDSSVRIVYVRNPISSTYSIYRPSTLYTSRYYPTYASYNYYPSYLYENNYYPFYPISPTTRYYSNYGNYRYWPSNKWQDLALYPSWRYNHFARNFDDETRLIRAQTSALLHRIHDPVPRKVRPLSLPYVSRYDYEMLPARLTNDNYIHRMILSTPSNKSEYTTYYSDPVRRYFGQGHLSCVTLCGEKNHPRRRNVYVYQDPVKNDIHLLSYYINRFRDEKALKAKPAKVKLDPFRATRIFSSPKLMEEEKESDEMKVLKAQRSARLTLVSSHKEEKIEKSIEKVSSKETVIKTKESKVSSKAAEKREDAALKQKEEERERLKKEKEQEEERARLKEEEQKRARQKEQEIAAEEEAKKQVLLEAQKKQQEAEKEAQEAAERAAESKRIAEQVRLEEIAKEKEIKQAKLAEEERQRQEEEKRLLEAAKEEEERKQLLRLEEIAKQAEEEKEAELARQAEELAELARQEALIAEQNKIEEERVESERKRGEEEDLHKKEAELEELVQKEQETEILAQQEEEIAEAARLAAEAAKTEAEEISLEVQAENVIEESHDDAPEGSADDFVFASDE